MSKVEEINGANEENIKEREETSMRKRTLSADAGDKWTRSSKKASLGSQSTCFKAALLKSFLSHEKKKIGDQFFLLVVSLS